MITIKNRLKAYAKYLLVIFSMFLILSLARNIGTTKESLKRIEKKQDEVNALEAKNAELKKMVDEVASDAFIEKQIRDQLGLAREGEIVLVMPPDEDLRKLVPKLPEDEVELPPSTWKKWLNLFVN